MRLFAIAAASMLLTSISYAEIVLYDGSAGGLRNGNYTVGSEIQVGPTSQTITHLGVQDVGGFGGGSFDVGVWSADGSTLLATTTISAASPVINTYHYAALKTPLTLDANTNYLIGAEPFNNGTNWFRDISAAPPYSAAPGYSITGNRFTTGTSLAAPTSDGTLALGRWAPANGLSLPGESVAVYNPNVAATARGDGPYTVGTLFRTGSNGGMISHLGIQDVNGDGFVGGDLQVGLWSGDGSTLLASATVSSSDQLLDTYRYAAIGSTLTLDPDTEYLIGATVGAGLEFFLDSQSASSSPFLPGTGFTLLQNRFNVGGTLSAPLNDGTLAIGRWSPANAIFIAPVPEPASLVMWGAIGLCLWRCRSLGRLCKAKRK